MSEEIVAIYSKLLSKENGWDKMIRVVFREFSPVIPYKVEIRCFRNGIPSHYGVTLDVIVFEKLMNNLRRKFYCIVKNKEEKRIFYLRSESSGAYISTIDHKYKYSILLTPHELIYIYHARKEIIDKCFEVSNSYRFWSK
jgi:hypothetical protein